jgi:hypothetical protein
MTHGELHLIWRVRETGARRPRQGGTNHMTIITVKHLSDDGCCAVTFTAKDLSAAAAEEAYNTAMALAHKSSAGKWNGWYGKFYWCPSNNHDPILVATVDADTYLRDGWAKINRSNGGFQVQEAK